MRLRGWGGFTQAVTQCALWGLPVTEQPGTLWREVMMSVSEASGLL